MLHAIRQLLPGPSKAPPKEDRAARGVFGEKQAAKFLRRKKHRIIAKNWRAGRDEIDLITEDGAVLVFVEVRSRDAEALVGGYDSVTAKKKQALLRACRAYFKALSRRPAHFRFDIVEVRLGNGGGFTIHHFENVPLFPAGF
ncbi:MAG: YraN family protein [Puniceicoccales bacterium]